MPMIDVTSLLVVGKTGAGKSSTANSILGRQAFRTEDSTTSVTQRCQRAYAEQQGRRVKVVDMPGLHDAELSQREDVQRIVETAAEAIAETPEGYDAILLVVSFGRFTQEDKMTADCLKEIYGKNSLKDHGIVVVTHGDQFVQRARNDETFQQWCSRQRGPFRELTREVNRRVVMFQNELNDQDVRSRQQLKELFSVVERVRQDHSHRYTPQLFELARAERERLEVVPITQATEAEIDLLYQELRELANGTSARDVARLRQLLERADGIATKIQNQDNGRGISNNVLMALEHLHIAIKATIRAVNAVNETTLAEDEIRLAENRRAEAELRYQEVIDEQNQNSNKIERVLMRVAIGLGITTAIAVLTTRKEPVFAVRPAMVNYVAEEAMASVVHTIGASLKSSLFKLW